MNTRGVEKRVPRSLWKPHKSLVAIIKAIASYVYDSKHIITYVTIGTKL